MKLVLRKKHKTENVKEGPCLSLRHRFPLAIAVFQLVDPFELA